MLGIYNGMQVSAFVTPQISAVNLPMPNSFGNGFAIKSPSEQQGGGGLYSLLKELKELNARLGFGDFLNDLKAIFKKPSLTIEIKKISDLGVSKLGKELEYINFPFSQDIDYKWFKSMDKFLALGPSALEVVEEGISTTYLIKDENGVKKALFKPDSGTSKYTDNEQSALREHLAWIVGRELLDLPPVFVVELNINGELVLGSLQPFVESAGSFNNYSIQFSQNLLEEVDDPLVTRVVTKELTRSCPLETRRLAMLDLLIQNFDRGNPANTLVKNTKYGHKLIPIDHNLAFSKKVELISFDSCFWYTSEAIRQPFSDTEVEWLNKFDIEAVKAKLANAGLDPQRINTFGIMAEFLQTGAKGGLTLFDIVNRHNTLAIGSTVYFQSPLITTIDNVRSMKLEGDKESAELRRQIHAMMMEEKDQINQYGKSYNAYYQEQIDKEMIGNRDYLNIVLSISREKYREEGAEVFNKYQEAAVCPKENLDKRFNATYAGKPVKILPL